MNDLEKNTSEKSVISDVSNEIVEVIKKYNMSYADALESMRLARYAMEKVKINSSSLTNR